MPFSKPRSMFGVMGALLLAVAARGAQFPDHPRTSPEITAADLSVRDKILSDDVFEGRGPGTAAGEASAQWVADEMKRIGLLPGNHGSYFQKVPAASITLQPAQSSFVLSTSQGVMPLTFAADMVYWTPRFVNPDVRVKDSPLVFVGYGVVAPEYHWDDYAGMDVRGKTVVILINHPGNEDPEPDPNFFKGKAMTYYGRWTYKYEEAARHGAAAALIVHEGGPAGYGWQVVRNSHVGARLWLEATDKNASLVPIQGWLTVDTARQLFRRAGLSYDTEKKSANQHDFRAVPLTGETLSVAAHSALSHLVTKNVIGVIRGDKHPDDYVLYSAHWDHLGVKPDLPGPDKIYNGAVDNAMGVSGILEIAEAFMHGTRPQRSVAFISWTLEESAVLGSEYFAEHPPWPLSHIVGGINTDADMPKGRAHDMIVIGSGASELEDMFAVALKTQGRTITPDPLPEKGLYYRSDHISLAKVGVPMIDPGGGFDLITGGTEAGKSIHDDYLAHRYHQPSDEWSADWDLSGVVQDMEAFKTLGAMLANSEKWPNWYAGNEFRAARDKMMAQGR